MTFRAYIEVYLGKRAAELATVAPEQQGDRTDLDVTSGHNVPKSEADEKKAKRLRAILRAPEVIQDLYRDGLVSQTAATLMGPKKPPEEQAVKVVQGGARKGKTRSKKG